MNNLGQDSSGDFDQLSLHGVDFGADYMEHYHGKVNDMEGEYMYANQMGYDARQLGYDADQMGLIPTGMGRSPDFGLIPSGMGSGPNAGRVPQGMGYYDNQLGGFMDTLKTPAFSLGGFPVTYMHLGIAALAGLAFYAHKQGMIKIPGL